MELEKNSRENKMAALVEEGENKMTALVEVRQLTFTLIIKIFNILNNNPPCTSTTVDIILCVWCRSFGARSEYDQDLLVFGFLFLKYSGPSSHSHNQPPLI